jgi:hypothetical protein
MEKYIGDFYSSDHNGDFSCYECKTIKLEDELKYINYNKSTYFLCDDCYSEHMKEDETMEVA